MVLLLIFGVVNLTLNKDPEQILGESSRDKYFVKKVIDGDTILVSQEENDYKVRLIGVDAPETVHPRKKVECFGKEAASAVQRFVENSTVRLEGDPSQYDKDRYGRLLRYVFLENGDNLNYILIKEGFAYEYTYQSKYLYQDEFKEAQEHAMRNNSGLWGALCDQVE